MGVAENLARVQERIRAACSRAGRDRDTVQLVAVSKGQPIEAVLLAFAAGQTVFGENYAQELHEKADALPEAEWHFIGALQTNKVKIVVGHSALVHTCDRASLANELSKRAEMKNIVQRVLLEVNVGREPQKGGALPEQVGALHAAVREMERLRCDSLMCIPPWEQDPRPPRPARAVHGHDRRFRGSHRGGGDDRADRHGDLRRATASIERSSGARSRLTAA